ncbi:hypothetical protein BRADI_2g07165v3 [Brachypodium distachyon]|uniref:Uncharacterized protein n=1 Tax=Brachypodium distachyon TaxID=15368 RepID=A0A2K2D7C5_BRADI|nr:hypothetical protein BRADI_2g07165v3 [Brachypodium distachyon]PNT70177.1 hypothetical protein BRADI_2g07165v3 [Brachypodium distachyon]
MKGKWKKKKKKQSREQGQGLSPSLPSCSTSPSFAMASSSRDTAATGVFSYMYLEDHIPVFSPVTRLWYAKKRCRQYVLRGEPATVHHVRLGVCVGGLASTARRACAPRPRGHVWRRVRCAPRKYMFGQE